MKRMIIDGGIVAVLALALAAPGWVHAEPRGAVAMADAPATHRVPLVKVEIEHQGRVLKGQPTRMNWDEAGEIRLERGDRTHDVTVAVSRKDDAGTKLHVTLTYELDGQRVIEDFAYDTKAKKREILRTDEVALAITVTTKVIGDGSPTGRGDKLQPGVDPNDPLGGL